MKKKLISHLFMVSTLMMLVGCGQSQKPVERAGVFVNNTAEGIKETEYVLCVSKNASDGEELLQAINTTIKNLDMSAVQDNYMDYSNRRSSKFLQTVMYELNDNTGDVINIIGTTFEPFNFAGYGGCFSDGIDTYIMFNVAESMNRQIGCYDALYDGAYETAKEGKSAEVLISGIALNDDIKKDFNVSDVYMKGKQQIISDKNEAFTKIEQLKGKTVGVVKGKEGESFVIEAIENGALKNTDTKVYVCDNDNELQAMLQNETCDVAVVDELAAKLIVKRMA